MAAATFFKKALPALFFLACAGARADLNADMAAAFRQMRHETRPEVFETERRGVVAGGSLSVRSPLGREDLLAVSAPGAKAGCRGIDLYAGSFSYVNREEFIKFLRAIAANAEGYAFEIALSSMCEKCAQHIETLQRKIQSLNEYFGNSCQLAQGVVNDTLGAFGRKGLNDASLAGQFAGAGDLFETSTATDTAGLYRSAARYEEASGGGADAGDLTGNLMWKRLMKSALFRNDPALAEGVMSMTGTVIVSEDGRDVSILPGGRITLKDLAAGGGAYLYRCGGGGECASVTVGRAELTGFAGLIRRYLLGDGDGAAGPDAAAGGGGIIGKYAANRGGFTEDEREFLAALPEGTGAMIRTLSARSEGAARLFAARTAEIMGLLYARNLVMSYLDAAGAAAAGSDNAYAGILRQKLTEVRETVNAETSYLGGALGGFGELSRIYRDYLALLPEEDYVPAEAAGAGDF